MTQEPETKFMPFMAAKHCREMERLKFNLEFAVWRPPDTAARMTQCAEGYDSNIYIGHRISCYIHHPALFHVDQ